VVFLNHHSSRFDSFSRRVRRRGHVSVKVFLPRAGVAVGDHERESVDAEQRPMKRKSSVLVVDHDKTVLKSTLMMLDFLGFAQMD
jgi:hypothetical protein